MATESAAESSQGHVPMESTPEPSSEPSRDLSIRDAANELSESRNTDESGVPDIISYRNSETGKRTDRRTSVSREQAAKDLAGYRESKVLEAERQEQDLVRAHADALRSGRQSPIDASLQLPQVRQHSSQPQQRSQHRLRRLASLES